MLYSILEMSSSEVHRSGRLLSFSLTLSNQQCMCTYASILGLDSFPPQALHHKTEGVATRWLNKHIAQLPITQIHLAPSCQHVSHSFTTSPVFGVRRGEPGGRKEDGRKKNNAEIMRISKKFLGGVFNFNHQDYPSSVALISPPSLPPLGVLKWRGIVSTWSDSACKGHRDKVQMWCLTQAFLRALREAPRT